MEEPARADVQQGVTTNIPAVARHDDRLGMLEIVRADHAVMHNVADIRASVGLGLIHPRLHSTIRCSTHLLLLRLTPGDFRSRSTAQIC